MIYIKLQGGLGNQLFQYATGKALSDAIGKPLVFDLYYLYSTHYAVKNETPRKYELGPYQLNVKTTAPGPKPSRLLPSSLIKYWYGFQHYKRFAHRITEKNFAEATSLQGNILLDGYFQDERYFIAIREELIKDIRLAHLPGQYQRFAEQISTSNSVAVHVRRGDYVSNKNASGFHGTLPLSYYQKAFDTVNARSGNCSFFFFSDDIKWVKEHFNDIPNATFVEALPDSIHAELELMKRCKHQVLANSSFSWWGAWLNDHPGKIVVAPKQWFADEERNKAFALPVDWMRI